MRGRSALLMIAMTAVLGAMAPANVAVAECTLVSKWPSFRQAAGSAERILVGTVVVGQTYATNQFVLRVDELLRGDAPPQIAFDRFRSGAPTPVCPEESVLRARIGDRIAIAYGARIKGIQQPIRAVAFVLPSKPDSLMRGAERLDITEVRELAGVDTGGPSSFETAPGVTAEALAVLPGQDDPVAFRFRFESGASIDVPRSPYASLVTIETGTLIVTADADLMVYAATDIGAAPRTAVSGSETTMEKGDYFLVPVDVGGHISNGGDTEAAMLIAALLVAPATPSNSPAASISPPS